MSDEKPTAVVLFDGVCNLCNSTVNFIIDRDPNAYFRFTALQSEAGKAVLARHNLAESAGDPDSVLLEENGVLYDRSTAALRIARKLSGLWKIFYAGIIVPRFIRDAVYKFIAKRRYKWFGKQEVCRVPTPALRKRFLAA